MLYRPDPPISFTGGGLDRADHIRADADKLAELKKADAGGYEHWAKIYPEKGHWMDREDREGVKWML